MITENTTIREFLQTLGTECLRDNLSKNIWAAALFADYTPIKIVGNIKQRRGGIKYLAEMPNWIITDMRFPNELEAVKERGDVTIKVSREIKHQVKALGGTTDVPKEYQLNNQHPSETALDDAEFDYEILNDGTLEDLVIKVREILIKEKLINK